MMKLNKITAAIIAALTAFVPFSSVGTDIFETSTLHANADWGDTSHIHPVDINANTFPDANFRKAVKKYDTDGDGYLSDKEISHTIASFIK